MQVDCAILGGGLVGCLTALHLDACGIRCVLIERDTLFHGASGNNAGGLYFQMSPQAGFSGHVKRNLLCQQIPLLKESWHAWNRLLARFDIPHSFPQGGAIVAITADEVEILCKKISFENDLGIHTEFLEHSELIQRGFLFERKILAASYCQNEGHIIPKLLADKIRKELANSQVHIALHTSIESIEKKSQFHIVTNHDEHINASFVIGALGAWMPWLMHQFHQPHGIYGYPIQMSSIAHPSAAIPCFTRYIGGRLSVKRLDSNTIYIGGGWPADLVDRKDNTEHHISINLPNLGQNLRLATQLFPSLSQASLVSCWANWVAWTQDGLPILGWVPDVPGLMVACGGNGFTLAPLYAEILRDLVTEKQPAISLDNFSIERFKYTNSKKSQLNHSPFVSLNEYRKNLNFLSQFLTRKGTISELVTLFTKDQQSKFQEESAAYHSLLQPD